jgi:putative ABC transport system ATP-binding protein
MYAMLKSLSGNTTVILVTHDSRAEAFGDQVVRIQDGRISEQWRHGEDERSVIDPFGWMRVRDSRRQFPIKPAAALQGLATEESTRLRTNGLSVTYGDMNLFANFDLQGAAGELIALSSRSGSGKSTLLRILGGMQNPTDGTISIGETFLTELNREDRAELRREFIGYLSQGDSAISNLSLSDYLGDARPTLEMDFGSRMKRPMSNFSGGERAWIQLQKLLSKPKPILLLDEPTSQMDERRSYQVAQLLIDFVSAGGLVVTSTRDHTLLESANRVISLTSA